MNGDLRVSELRTTSDMDGEDRGIVSVGLSKMSSSVIVATYPDPSTSMARSNLRLTPDDAIKLATDLIHFAQEARKIDTDS